MKRPRAQTMIDVLLVLAAAWFIWFVRSSASGNLDWILRGGA